MRLLKSSGDSDAGFSVRARELEGFNCEVAQSRQMNNQSCISSVTTRVICCTDGQPRQNQASLHSTRCTVPEVCPPLVFSGEPRKGVLDIRRRQPREEQKGPEVFP